MKNKKVVIIGNDAYLFSGFEEFLRKYKTNFFTWQNWEKNIETLKQADIVINFCINPLCFNRSFTADEIIDVQIAKALQNSKTRFVFISSRKVYGSSKKLKTYKETDDLIGSDYYSRNKITAENALLKILPNRLTILRLSNIIGEIPTKDNYKTFLGWIVNEYKHKEKIFVDHAKNEIKDFITKDYFHNILNCVIKDNITGIYNVSSNIPFSNYEILNHLAGKDNLDFSNNDEVCEQFLLDNSKIVSQTMFKITKEDIIVAANKFKNSLLNKIKVCYIITKLELGGAQKFTLHTAKYLNKKNFQTCLICGCGAMLDEEASKNVKTIFVKSLVRQISPLNDLSAVFDIYKILKKQKPDIVHTHSSKAGIVGRIAAKLAGIKYIVHTIHGYSFNDSQKFYIKYLYIFLERFCSLFSKKLIVENERDLQKGIENKISQKNKFEIICSGIDTEKYKNYNFNADFKKSLVADNSKIILTVGPFKPQKNLSDFIKAAAIVSKQYNDVSFFIIGDGALRKDLESLIKNLNLENTIKLLGWKTQIIDYLYACDIFVMTSLWEGLPRTILDVMCCAKPVVANNVGGIADVIKDGISGFLTNPKDYKSTANIVLKLLNNDALAHRIGQNAKGEITRKYDINYNTMLHENLYSKLISIGEKNVKN